MSTEYLNALNVLDFGAMGDGITDDTEAFDAALTKAGETGNTVVVPAGRYCIGELHVPPHIVLRGTDSFSRTEDYGSVLLFNQADASCMLNLTGARGAVIGGLTLHGNGIGDCIHGIYAAYDVPCEETDYFHIEDCKCTHFSGDGIHFVNVNKAGIHHCLFCDCQTGVLFDGQDLQFIDNRCSTNRIAGFASGAVRLSHLIGCRFDHNAADGIRIAAAQGLALHCINYQENGCAGLSMPATAERMHTGVTVTASTFRDNASDADAKDAGQARFLYIAGLTMTGNTFKQTTETPQPSLCVDFAEQSVISGNIFVSTTGIRSSNLKRSVTIENNIG